MERQLDARAAVLLKRAVRGERQSGCCWTVATARFGRHGHVEGVELRTAACFAADTVVVAVGIKRTPKSPLTPVSRSIAASSSTYHLVTSNIQCFRQSVNAPSIAGVCYGLVEPANEQARALAERLAGRDARYLGSVNATNLKVSGVHVFSAGDFSARAAPSSVVLSDQGLGTYRKLVIAGDRVVGGRALRRYGRLVWYLDLIRSGAAIDSVREDLISVEHWASGLERPASARRNS